MRAEIFAESHILRLIEFTGQREQVLYRQRLIQRITPRGKVALRQFNAIQQRRRRKIKHQIKAVITRLSLTGWP